MKEFEKNIKPHLEKLSKTMLFKNIDQTHILEILTCLNPKLIHYTKGQLIINEGDSVSNLSIVVSGSVHIQTLDYWGNNNIKAKIGEYEIFGETFACLPHIKANCQASAQSNCTILSLNINTMLTPAKNQDTPNFQAPSNNVPSIKPTNYILNKQMPYYNQLLHNMLNILATKNYMLTQKIDVMNKKTTREKLIEFLTQQSKQKQSKQFTIDFNRQQLADYLAVDRSGLSSEISKLVQEGIIETQRNKFTLL